MSFPLISNNQQHSTNRLYKHFRLFSFFTVRNFMEQYFQVPENGETGHFFDPAPGCPSKSILALPKSKVSQSKTTAPPPEFPVSLLGSSAPPPASPVSPPVPHSFTALAFIPLLKPAFHYPSPRFHRPRHCTGATGRSPICRGGRRVFLTHSASSKRESVTPNGMFLSQKGHLICQ